jgi:membrane-associated phospholipid phosphatase
MHVLCFFLACIAGAPDARAACIEHPASSLAPRLARLGEPVPLVLLGGAVVAPFVLAPTGVDQHARVFAERDLGGHYDAERITKIAPFSLTAALAVGYGVGLVEADCAATAVTARSLQAMGLAFLVMSISKLVVGRTYPAGDPHAADRLVDDGRSTRAHPFESFGAWPSGHAAVTFAFAAAVRTSLPSRAGPLRYGGYALATAVSAGMMFSDHHWASDIVSGALLGEAIGRSVGAPLEAGRPRVELVPTGMGLAIVGSL